MKMVFNLIAKWMFWFAGLILLMMHCWICSDFVQDKLQTLAAGHSDILETLSPKVRKRVEVLREIQVSLPLNAIGYECRFALVYLSWIPLLLVSIYINLMTGFEVIAQWCQHPCDAQCFWETHPTTPPPQNKFSYIQKKKNLFDDTLDNH